MKFVWQPKNIEHIAEHGISPEEAEYLVEHARPPYPQMIGDKRRLVVGRFPNGEFGQVIYAPSRSVPGSVYVIHSRLLTEAEKQKFRRRTR